MEKWKNQISYKIILKAANIAFLILLAAGVNYWLTYSSVIQRGISSYPSYMVYYGQLDDAIIEQAKQYDIVIVHPKQGNITRDQVAEMQKAGVCVLGY